MKENVISVDFKKKKTHNNNKCNNNNDTDNAGNEFVPSNSLMQMELNQNSSENFWLDHS